VLAAGELRFYLDENIPIEIARQLRKRNIEVVTVRDLNLLGDEDENHLSRATEMGYVLCTNDTDYVELAADGMQHTGIVIGQPEKHYIGDWVKWLELMHAVYSPDDMQNRVEYL
jgi:hypothetical protein